MLSITRILRRSVYEMSDMCELSERIISEMSYILTLWGFMVFEIWSSSDFSTISRLGCFIFYEILGSSDILVFWGTWSLKCRICRVVFNDTVLGPHRFFMVSEMSDL